MESVNLKTKSGKRKTAPDCKCSSSVDEDAVYHKEKRLRSKANKFKKVYHETSTDKKEFKKLPEKTKKEYGEITKQKNDKQIQSEVWYYLLHHLEDPEKLIALKLLVGINKMKKNWRDNFQQNEYVDKKVVEDMKLVIKNLQDEKKKNEAEKQKLIQEKNKLEQEIIEERKCRIHLAEIIANGISKSKEASNKVEVLDKIEVLSTTEDKLQNQTFTGIVSEQKPSGSKILSDDSSNNTQVSKIKGDSKKEGDLREVLNSKENLGNKEHHMNFIQPSIRHFFTSTPRSYNRRTPRKINDRLCIHIRTTIKRFPELIKKMEDTLRSQILINRAVPINEGWKIEFFSLQEKMHFFNQRRMFSHTGLYITNPYWQ